VKNLVDVKRLIKRFEKEYDEEKKNEVRELYNKLIDTVSGANVFNALAALKLVETTLLLQKIKAIYPEIFK